MKHLVSGGAADASIRVTERSARRSASPASGGGCAGSASDDAAAPTGLCPIFLGFFLRCLLCLFITICVELGAALEQQELLLSQLQALSAVFALVVTTRWAWLVWCAFGCTYCYGFSPSGQGS